MSTSAPFDTRTEQPAFSLAPGSRMWRSFVPFGAEVTWPRMESTVASTSWLMPFQHPVRKTLAQSVTEKKNAPLCIRRAWGELEGLHGLRADGKCSL